jgi:hypothetical protein
MDPAVLLSDALIVPVDSTMRLPLVCIVLATFNAPPTSIWPLFVTSVALSVRPASIQTA